MTKRKIGNIVATLFAIGAGLAAMLGVGENEGARWAGGLDRAGDVGTDGRHAGFFITWGAFSIDQLNRNRRGASEPQAVKPGVGVTNAENRQPITNASKTVSRRDASGVQSALGNERRGPIPLGVHTYNPAMDDQQTYLLNGLLSRNFGLGRIVRFRQVARGRQAETFEVLTQGQHEYVVYLYPAGFGQERLNFSARAMNLLDKQRFSLVPMLPVKSGEGHGRRGEFRRRGAARNRHDGRPCDDRFAAAAGTVQRTRHLATRFAAGVDAPPAGRGIGQRPEEPCARQALPRIPGACHRRDPCGFRSRQCPPMCANT